VNPGPVLGRGARIDVVARSHGVGRFEAHPRLIGIAGVQGQAAEVVVGLPVRGPAVDDLAEMQFGQRAVGPVVGPQAARA
jgi:hypothetical protein